MMETFSSKLPHCLCTSTKTSSPLPKPFLHGNHDMFLPSLFIRPSSFTTTHRKSCQKPVGIRSAVATVTERPAVFYKKPVVPKPSTVTAIVTASRPIENIVDETLDDLADQLGKTLVLDLVSNELDPNTGSEKTYIKGFAKRTGKEDGDIKYEAVFKVPSDFGEVGAVLITNKHRKEMFFKSIVLVGFPNNGQINFTCESWVPVRKSRVFFSNKSYLPDQTPDGLKSLREEELEILRGDGQGERMKGDRIYDYDVYNDLGNPDKDPELARPVLGGEKNPYPRRCRTGRPHCQTDKSSEEPSSYVYVPRDEEFSEIKAVTFSVTKLSNGIASLIPRVQTVFDSVEGFPYFTVIDKLYNEGIDVPAEAGSSWKQLIPDVFKDLIDTARDVFRFDTPELMERDKFAWFRDEEFARQTLAGLNPCCIKLVTEWPLKSNLDPETYGSPDSLITTELVEEELDGVITVDEALEQKKLFILDYHDLLLPFVEQVRNLERTTLYGSRTLFFLTSSGQLKPIAIELTRPKMGEKPQWRQVYTPTLDATDDWLWRLAKTQVLSQDSGYHQLISHWLRTHCSTEPYVIAANRQLSAMHPIYRLLHPHFRYTMEINARARSSLINAKGVIESTFAPGKYSFLLSSVIYDKLWQFDQEALPKDLVKRGMAVEDPSQEHGLKLTIEDYPYANDGLILWDAIKEWMSDYINHYYPSASVIQADEELQAWWKDVLEKGHPDKKEGWPELQTPGDLVDIATTIAWVASGHHAAVNFGQYAYAGYFPNRPTITRENMPDEDNDEQTLQTLSEKPEILLLKTFPSQVQATTVMIALSLLSDHSPDEEYIGKQIEPVWAEDPVIKNAFDNFSKKLHDLQGTIDQRNKTSELRNRNGAGVVPYELLKPYSGPGVTGKGVPYSVSI